MYRLTSTNIMQLLVVTTDTSGQDQTAQYNSFAVLNATTNYQLSVYGFSGFSGNDLIPRSGYSFSTFDNDNDKNAGTNCAETALSGWWYTDCYQVNLNGPIASGKFYWFRDLRASVMLIRKSTS